MLLTMTHHLTDRNPFTPPQSPSLPERGDVKLAQPTNVTSNAPVAGCKTFGKIIGGTGGNGGKGQDTGGAGGKGGSFTLIMAIQTQCEFVDVQVGAGGVGGEGGRMGGQGGAGGDTEITEK